MIHDITLHRKRLDSLLMDHKHTSRLVKEEKKILDELEQKIQYTEHAQSALQEIAQTIQQTVHGRIASVVTKCLQVIFQDDAPEFHIKFERKRGKTEASLLFVRDGNELNPLDENGGGTVDVAAFALRVACLLMQRPPVRLLFVADEPFKNINGEEYQSRVGGMIEMLADEFGMQFIFCSDDEWLKIGKVIDLERE